MVSVVVIGKNEGQGITKCLESVRAALEGVLAYEMIYVDSHSTDDSLRRAASLGARCFLPKEHRTTPALGRFIGGLEAQGEYVLFLDGDMALHPGFVQSAIEAISRAGARCAGACGIRRDVYMREGQVVGVRENYFGCEAARVCPEFGGAVMLRRDALARAGSWTPGVETCEEAELHARLRRENLFVLELPVAMITHTDRVREARGVLGLLVNRRRLGQGQAMLQALRSASVLQLMQADLSARAWALAAAGLLLSLAAWLWGGVIWAAVVFAAAQAALFLLLAFLGRARTLVSALLALFYVPAGMLSFRRRDEGYARWEESA